MKKFKIVISIFIVLFIVLSSVVSTLAVSIVSANDKISVELHEVVSRNKDNLVSVYIFLKDCDKSEINTNLEEKYNYNIKAYENPALYYTEVVPNIAVDKKTVSDLLGEEKATPEKLSLDNEKSSVSIETRKKINKAMVDDMNKYLGRYRDEVSEVVGDYVTSFIDDNEELIEKITVQPRGGEFIIAEVKGSNVLKIAKSQYVNKVSLHKDLDFEPYGWNATSVTHCDYETGLGSDMYNYGSGYDGTGVKIGIIEAGSGMYRVNNYNLSDADITYVFPPGVGTAFLSDHATNVASLICGKKVTIDGKQYGGPASGATVYQTGVRGDDQIYSTLDMLIYDYNVNVINMSFGNKYDSSIHPSYDDFEATIDDIVENQRVTIVLAVGNSTDNPGGVITSPANSYNTIVVGNLMTKHYHVILDPPFPINTSSFYFESEYLPNKPDVVAPGTKINLPTSDTTIGDDLFGNSYSAPIVTGIVAQLMQDNVLAMCNPNAVKNFIISGADSNAVDDDSTAYGVLKDRSGAGVVNAVNSFEIADSDLLNNYYGVYLASQSAPTEYKTIATFDLAKGDNLRAALTFEKEENILLTQEYGNNIDIRLVRNNPYSTYCVASESTNNNVELIDTKVPSTGIYWLQIRFTESILEPSINNELHYWVSWRVY